MLQSSKHGKIYFHIPPNSSARLVLSPQEHEDISFGGGTGIEKVYTGLEETLSMW